MSAEPTVPRPAPPCALPGQDQSRWFQVEVRAHEAQLKAYLHGAFPGVPDLDDVVQESYLRIWKAKTVQPVKSAKSYLFTIARNLALGWLRHRKISPVDAMGDLATLRIIEDKPNAAEATSQSEKLELAVQALMALPPRCRETVMLRKLKGLSQKETAEIRGVSVKTVDKQLAEGLTRLEAHLRRHGINRLFD